MNAALGFTLAVFGVAGIIFFGFLGALFAGAGLPIAADLCVVAETGFCALGVFGILGAN